jgi:hypothetical protein
MFVAVFPVLSCHSGVCCTMVLYSRSSALAVIDLFVHCYYCNSSVALTSTYIAWYAMSMVVMLYFTVVSFVFAVFCSIRTMLVFLEVVIP